MSFLRSSSLLFFGLPSGRVSIGFHLYTFPTILSFGIRYKWPNQLNLYAFIVPISTSVLSISSCTHLFFLAGWWFTTLRHIRYLLTPWSRVLLEKL